ncbi:orotate phosphoribosyltransferase [Gordonia sinesedis]
MSASSAPRESAASESPAGRESPTVNADDRAALAALVSDLSVVHGRVTLSSGKEADYYVDLRRATLQHQAAPLIGRLMRELTADWDFDAVGGLTLGADPVATAMMHAPGRPIDAFVVRKAAKTHGMQRRIEGADMAGRRVLVVEDTSTTGGSPSEAVRAAREAGAEVVGVATVVDRATGAGDVIAELGVPYRSLLGLADLGLA